MDHSKLSLGKRAAVGMVTLAAVGGAAEIAVAKQFKTSVKLTSVAPEGAKGKVTSSNPKCERGRKVTLFFEGPSDDMKIGTDKTNKKGKFSVEESLFAGSYYVKVAKKTLGKPRGLGASGRTVCKGKKSKSKKG
ncbi:MAG: hypothetical protein JJE23_05905 [Thermoleophilia bacterium]|nr:hypothetical protein [Thermoleophilia bacterium]